MSHHVKGNTCGGCCCNGCEKKLPVDVRCCCNCICDEICVTIEIPSDNELCVCDTFRAVIPYDCVTETFHGSVGCNDGGNLFSVDLEFEVKTCDDNCYVCLKSTCLSIAGDCPDDCVEFTPGRSFCRGDYEGISRTGGFQASWEDIDFTACTGGADKGIGTISITCEDKVSPACTDCGGPLCDNCPCFPRCFCIHIVYFPNGFFDFDINFNLILEVCYDDYEGGWMLTLPRVPAVGSSTEDCFPGATILMKMEPFSESNNTCTLVLYSDEIAGAANGIPMDLESFNCSSAISGGWDIEDAFGAFKDLEIFFSRTECASRPDDPCFLCDLSSDFPDSLFATVFFYPPALDIMGCPDLPEETFDIIGTRKGCFGTDYQTWEGSADILGGTISGEWTLGCARFINEPDDCRCCCDDTTDPAVLNPTPAEGCSELLFLESDIPGFEFLIEEKFATCGIRDRDPQNGVQFSPSCDPILFNIFSDEPTVCPNVWLVVSENPIP